MSEPSNCESGAEHKKRRALDLSPILPIGAVSLATLYGVGYVLTLAATAKLGVGAGEVRREQAISLGAVFALTLFPGLVSIFYSVLILGDRPESWKKWAKEFFSALFIIIITGGLVYCVGTASLFRIDPQRVNLIAYLLIAPFIIYFFAFVNAVRGTGRRKFTPFVLGFTLVGFNVSAFPLLVFPSLLPQFGGWFSSRTTITTESRTYKLFLLYEDNTSLIGKTEDGQMVRVPLSTVQEIRAKADLSANSQSP